MQTQFCKQKNHLTLLQITTFFWRSSQKLYCLKHKEHHHFCRLNSNLQDSSVGRVSDQYRHWVQFLGAAARDLSLRVYFQCRFSYHVPGRKTPSYFLAYLPCPHSPLVRLHASTSVCTLQIPNTGNHAIVWTHKNTYCTC